jgi:hypothetical protein
VQKACDDDLTKAIPVDMELGGGCPLNGGFSEEEPSMPRGGTTMDENE